MVTSERAHLRFDLPDGLVAVPRGRRVGDDAMVARRDRRGRAKLDEVEIVASARASVEIDFDDAEQRFVLGAARRTWKTIERHYGSNALHRAHALARARVITLRCRVDENLQLTVPLSWHLTEPWLARRRQALAGREQERDHWQARKTAAADAVEDACPQLAETLRTVRPLLPTLPVLVYAAEDLASGVVHDGPRAFSQRHFGHTKERDDVAVILRKAGVPAPVLAQLGVRRSGRIGVAGPITVAGSGVRYSVRGFDGPQLLRTDQPDLEFALEQPGPLAVIENLQAAETVADRYPDLAVVYGAGYTGPRALALIERLAADATDVVLIPDADADGAMIAARWLSVAPTARIVDIGEIEHVAGEPLPGWARRKLAALAEEPAGRFAQAILRRGYSLEEEMLVIRALERALALGGR